MITGIKDFLNVTFKKISTITSSNNEQIFSDIQSRSIFEPAGRGGKGGKNDKKRKREEKTYYTNYFPANQNNQSNEIKSVNIASEVMYQVISTNAARMNSNSLAERSTVDPAIENNYVQTEPSVPLPQIVISPEVKQEPSLLNNQQQVISNIEGAVPEGSCQLRDQLINVSIPAKIDEVKQDFLEIKRNNVINQDLSIIDPLQSHSGNFDSSGVISIVNRPNSPVTPLASSGLFQLKPQQTDKESREQNTQGYSCVLL